MGFKIFWWTFLRGKICLAGALLHPFFFFFFFFFQKRKAFLEVTFWAIGLFGSNSLALFAGSHQ